MVGFLRDYATVILLVLFAGIMFWAFQSKKRKGFQNDAAVPLDDGEDRPR